VIAMGRIHATAFTIELAVLLYMTSRRNHNHR